MSALGPETEKSPPSPGEPGERSRWVRVGGSFNVAGRYRARFGSTISETVERVLRLGVLVGLLIAAAATFINALASLAGKALPQKFGDVVPIWLNAALLIFIVLELAQTVRQQIDARERLSQTLVCNLVAIGVLSSVRHLLAVGAEMTLQERGSFSWATRRGEILELGVSAGIVLLLVIGWRLAGGTLPGAYAD